MAEKASVKAPYLTARFRERLAVLRQDVKNDDVRREFAQRAVKRLEQAITMRDSEFVVTWRDWVVSEDRALDRLAKSPRSEPMVGGRAGSWRLQQRNYGCRVRRRSTTG